MTACNSVHSFLNLKIFSKYGTIFLVLILIVIIANLLEYNLGLRNYTQYRNSKHSRLEVNNTIEGFEVTNYGFPDLFYLKVKFSGTESSDKNLYINEKGQYKTTNLLSNEMKSNPYRVFLNETTSPNEVYIRVPVLVSEFLDILSSSDVTLTREQQSTLASNQYIDFKLEPTESETHETINKNTSFNLSLINPDIKLDNEGNIGPSGHRLNLILKSGNIIGLVPAINENVSKINEKGTFKIQSKSEAENLRFQPIIPNTLQLKIHPSNNEIDIVFNVDPSQKDIDHFLIVLAKYDYKRNLVGHLKVHTSVESGASKKNICYMDAGVRKCNYTLTDIDHIDSDGNILYYRVSVIPVDINGISGSYVEPTYPGGYSHFLMSKSEKEMDKVIKKVKEMEHTEKQRAVLHDEIVSNVGGEYEYLKKQLGNYPNNLLLDTNKNTLNDLVNKSMALGEINLDMSLA
jgi:hypothetical protein